MAEKKGHSDDSGQLERLHLAAKELAVEWENEIARGTVRSEELKGPPANIDEPNKKFYKRLPVSQWDLMTGNYELYPLTHFRQGEELNVIKSIGIGVGIGSAVLLIGLAIILLNSK
jgi:hypothetical protein